MLGLGLGLDKLTQLGSGVASGDTSNGYRFATNYSHPMLVKGSATTSGKEYNITRIATKTPNYTQTNPRLLFTNFYVDQTGASSPEHGPGNSLLIEAAGLEISNTVYPLTFNGEDSITLEDGGWIWSDPIEGVTLAANATLYYWTATKTEVGAYSVGGYRPRGSTFDRASTGASSFAANIASRTLPSSASSGLYMYGPIACIAQGWEAAGSPPVPLVVGDSIAWSQNEDARSSDARGNRGYIQRGLDDSTSSTRMAFGLFAVPGTRLSNLSNTTGEWKLRYNALKAVGWPFTIILSEMGVNSIAGLGSAQLLSDHDSAMDFCHSMGNKLVVQTTLTPKTDSDTSQWTTLAGQTVNSINRVDTGERGALNDYILSGGKNDRYIDLRSYFFSTGSPPDNSKWKLRTFTSTLQSAVSSGTSISLAAAPDPGALLVIEPSTSNAEQVVVNSVTGTGPYTVNIFGAITKTHSSGATVTEAPTSDGTHPSTTVHIAASAGIIAAKNAGIFDGVT